MILRKRHVHANGTPPCQPDYPDDLTDEQMEAIRRMTDPEGARTAKRKLLQAAGW